MITRGQRPLSPDEIHVQPHKFYTKLKFPNIWENNISDSFKIVVAFVPIDNENTEMHIRSYQRSVRMPVLREITNFFFGIANGVVVGAHVS